MNEFSFQIDGKILGWKRPAGQRHRYDPPEQTAYKRMVYILCQQAMHKARVPTFTGDVSFGVVAFYARPRTIEKRVWKTSVPDLDNIFKNIKDALKGLAWIDDAQVCHYKPSGKLYLPVDSPLREHAIVRISDAPTIADAGFYF